jgi:hypothetical protein
MARQAEKWETGALLRAIRAFNTAANDVKGGWQPQLPLELAVVECTAPTPAPEAPNPTSAVASAAHAPEPLRPASRSARAPSAPRAASAPVSAAAPSGEAVDLKEAWGRFIRALLERNKITKLTAADLEKCVLEGFEGSVLQVSTPNKVFLEKIGARPDVIQVMENALSEVLGFDCGIKFQLANSRAGRGREAGDVPPDGMVATALRDLGGEIVE